MKTQLNNEQDAVNPLDASFRQSLLQQAQYLYVPVIISPPCGPDLYFATLPTQSQYQLKFLGNREHPTSNEPQSNPILKHVKHLLDFNYSQRN